jgi:hypothetical protein
MISSRFHPPVGKKRDRETTSEAPAPAEGQKRYTYTNDITSRCKSNSTSQKAKREDATTENTTADHRHHEIPELRCKSDQVA